jgi:hypothetical protein
MNNVMIDALCDPDPNDVWYIGQTSQEQGR